MEINSNQARFISVDTSALISFFNPSDSNHTKAASILENLANKPAVMITAADAYSEMLNTIWKKLGRIFALEVADYLAQDSQFILVDTTDLFPQALEKFKSATSSPSFTDCIVMATADKFQTKEVFGFDECFSKNGYTLPK